MNELEGTQPEENLESTESKERVEDQALDDATHEPGARVEESQSIEQAESVEDTLVTAMDDLKVEKTEEDGSIDRDEFGTADGSEISEGSGKDDDGGEEATPINLPGPIAENDDQDMQLNSGPSRDDLPDGTGILEEPHETIAGAEPLEDQDIVDRAEIPEGIELELAQGEDDDKDEATPINLPGPVAAGAEGVAGGVPVPLPKPTNDASKVIKDHPGPGGNVAQETVPDPEPDFRVAEEPEPGPDPFTQPAESPDPGGEPPGPNVELSPDDVKDGVALDHTGPGGNVAKPIDPNDPPPPPDMSGQSELSPDDVKMDDNLQPAPDYEAMSVNEQSVVDIISKAISDEEYRTTLFEDARTAFTGYAVTDEDQTALGEMTKESFDFLAAEVEKRFGEAAVGVPEGAQQKLLQHVVHAVWRDLNPGGLAYILAYKIPQKHL